MLFFHTQTVYARQTRRAKKLESNNDEESSEEDDQDRDLYD